jgi:ribosome-associated toxin RatA of RatAB toxin-antitoxin module
MARTDNAVVIEAPLRFVWGRMNDIESWPQLFSEYAEATVLEREGDTVRFRLTTHPDPEHDGAVWTWVSERTADPATHTTSARRLETGPFEFMHIDWAFAPVAGGTEMRWMQHFTMKPGAPVDDAGAVEYLNRNTRTQMAVIKERLEHAHSEAPTVAA